MTETAQSGPARFETLSHIFKTGTVDQRYAVSLDLANACLAAGRVSDGMRVLEAAIAVPPDQRAETPAVADLRVALARALFSLGRADRAVEMLEAVLAVSPGHRLARFNRLSYLHAVPGLDQGRIDRAHAQAFAALKPLAKPGGPVRAETPVVGLVSADFTFHPVGRLVHGLLSRWPRDRLTPVLFSSRDHTGPFSARIFDLAGQVHHTQGWDLAAWRARLAERPVDVLIDLNGLTSGSQYEVFRARLAPIQATWLGYTGRTFAPGADYMISDSYLTDPAAAAAAQTDGGERILPMPAPFCRWSYVPAAAAPPVATEIDPARAHALIAPHRADKLNPDCLGLWGAVLRNVPNSTLTLIGPNVDDPGTVTRIRTAFDAQGIETGRVRIHGPLGFYDYLRALGAADLMLDAMPFSGGMTSCDALWMGLPVLTLPAATIAGRQTAGLLRCLGLEPFIATGPQDYVQRAYGYLSSPDARRQMKTGLRPKMAASPLCDHAGFAGAFADTIATMIADHNARQEGTP